MKEDKFITCVIDGKEKKFKILYTFNSMKTKKNYIIYTEDCLEENKVLELCASLLKPNTEHVLEDIENDEDWNEVDEFLKQILGDKNE